MIHIIKRTAVILAAAAVCLSFTSCFELAYGLYDLGKDIAEEGERHTEFLEKQKEEREALVENYSPAFRDKAAEIYGSGAALTDIRVVTNPPDRMDDGYVNYDEVLIATLTVDGKQYEATYDCYEGDLKGRFRDSVHINDICSPVIDALPLDKSRIVETVYPMNCSSYRDYGDELKIDYRIKTFDEWVTFGDIANNPMYLYVFTTEDISGISEDEICSAPGMKKLTEATSYANITVVSLRDTEALDALKAQMRKNSSSISQLSSSVSSDEATKRFVDEYHITSAMVIRNSFTMLESEKDKERVPEIKIIK